MGNLYWAFTRCLGGSACFICMDELSQFSLQLNEWGSSFNPYFAPKKTKAQKDWLICPKFTYSLFQQIFAYSVLGVALGAEDTTVNKKDNNSNKIPVPVEFTEWWKEKNIKQKLEPDTLLSEGDKCYTGKQNSEWTTKGLFGGLWVVVFVLKSVAHEGLMDKVSFQERPEGFTSTTRVLAAEPMFQPLHLRPLHCNAV